MAPAFSTRKPLIAGSSPRPAPTPRSHEPAQAQFARGLAAALRQGGGTVTLHLKPEVLGDLKIRLHVRGTSVEARFEAATDAARGLLNESIDALRAALEARGLEVERLSVHVAERRNEHEAQDAHPRDAGTQRQGGQSHGRRRAARRPRDDEPGTEVLAIPVARAETLANVGGALRLDAIA